MRSPSFAGVILAAGESSRMGRDKALLTWKGRTFVQAHLELLRQHSELVIVVAGKNFNALEPPVYSSGGFLISNPAPELGQFSSLQIGLREVLNRGRDAALVALVDRPPCKSETVALLKERFRTVYAQAKWATVPDFQGKHGHPIIAGREMIEAFLQAPVTSNAREVEHSVPDKIDYFPVQDPAVAININTPEDYERLEPQNQPE